MADHSKSEGLTIGEESEGRSQTGAAAASTSSSSSADTSTNFGSQMNLGSGGSGSGSGSGSGGGPTGALDRADPKSASASGKVTSSEHEKPVGQEVDEERK
ncbi:hypothetical protein H2198_008141 [Neophaeococcomyces mojaviensis]|uniref:Uncharacterized protein n=1 Tax=Neophaeococcomyces mojaviensis TaxID=3383035 RepID=A0ACC2ZY69_9EURO|nr:hypothetical protein H2198_008141 [Knufia sp. JES_112]